MLLPIWNGGRTLKTYKVLGEMPVAPVCIGLPYNTVFLQMPFRYGIQSR